MNSLLRSLAAVLCVTTVAACTSGGTRPAARATSPATSPAPSVASSAPPSAPPTLTPTPIATVQVAIGPLQLHVPRGWPSASDNSFSNVCVAPPGKKAQEVFGCGGLDVWYGWDGYLPGNEMANFDRAHPGWYHATDVQPCPVDPTKGKDGLNGIRDDGLVGAESLKPVGDHTAYFYQWHAHCDSGYKFSPRAWYLPASNILVFDYVGNSTVDAVLTTRLSTPAAGRSASWTDRPATRRPACGWPSTKRNGSAA